MMANWIHVKTKIRVKIRIKAGSNGLGNRDNKVMETTRSRVHGAKKAAMETTRSRVHGAKKAAIKVRKFIRRFGKI
jgi:hypothetical protein